MSEYARCHCCKAYQEMCDDFGYRCEQCDDRHCSGCVELGGTCKKCAEVNVQQQCLFCKVLPISAKSIHEHHVSWKRFGFPDNGYTIKLCSNHHHKLHAWIESEAIKICLARDPIFFKNKTAEYFTKIIKESVAEKEILKNAETHVGEIYQ